MATFLYRCPLTLQLVQGWVAEEHAGNNNQATIKCLACGGWHVVDPKTGKTIGQSNDRSPGT